MTQREKALVGAVATAGALWFGSQGLTQYRDAISRNAAVQLEAEQALADAQFAELRGQKARKQLNEWISQSLPVNREVAESLYQDWLRSQLTGAGLEVAELSDKSGRNRNPQFGEVSIDARATGTLAQVADFLYRFYTAPHLHRLAGATVTATDGGQKLTLNLTASALILPDAKRADRLADGEPLKLAKSLEAYRDALVGRNLFVAYSPKSDAKASEQKDEIAAGSVVTAMYYGLGGWQMDVRKKDAADLLHFHQGDEIEIGKVKGKVIDVDGDRRRAIIETDKGRIEIRLGQNFGEAVAVEAPAA